MEKNMKKMTYEDAKRYIKENIRYFLSLELSIDLKKGKNIKCLNPAHDDKHPSMSFYEKNNTLHCFSCRVTYDTFDLVGLKYQLTNKSEIFKKALEIFDIKITSEKPQKKKETIENKEIKMEHKTDYTSYLDECYARIHETDYWKARGLSEETINKYHIGYDPDFESNGFKFPALILPTGRNSYTARNILKDADHKNRYRKVGSADCFNLDILGKTDSPIFVVEGIFDALAISEVGGNAIALGTTGNNLFMEAVKKVPSCSPLIIALDNDDAGRDASSKLIPLLTAMEVLCVSADISGSHKDANEALCANRENFQRSIEDAVKGCENALAEAKENYLKENSTNYQISDFLKAVTNPQNIHPTGFNALDSILDGGLSNQLILLGAVPSLGKTTFCLNIANNLAQDGQDVLIFSYEMGKHELMAKLLSLTTYQLDRKLNNSEKHAKTTQNIMSGKFRLAPQEDKDLFYTALIEFEKNSKHLFIYDCDKMSTQWMRDTVQRHIRLTGNRPIVIVDYVQIMPPISFRNTDKMNVDNNIRALKLISRDLKVTIIGISSFNRTGYDTSVNMTSFKESGSFEYGADVLIGLQYTIEENQMKKSSSYGHNRIREQREKASNGGTIPIELVVLKNRNGVTGSCILDFCPRFNVFSNHEICWG